MPDLFHAELRQIVQQMLSIQADMRARIRYAERLATEQAAV